MPIHRPASLLALAMVAGLTGQAALAEVPATPATTTYAFGKASQVAYHMVHQLHEFTGTTHSLRGKVALAGGKLVTPLKLQIPLVSFDSGNTNRDTNALLVLEAGKYPTVALTVSKFSETSRTQAGDAMELAGDAAGTLVLHGVTRSLTIPLKARVAPDALTVDATFEVSLTDYGIERPSLLFKPVEDAVRLTVHGVAAPAP